MSDNVINGHFRTRLDIDPAGVLDGAKGKVNQVLVLGNCEDGELYVAASTAKKETLLYLIERFKFKLLHGDFDE
jgi:hypothetical protein